MNHMRIWAAPVILGIAGSAAMSWWSDFQLSFWILLALSVPFMAIGGSFGYGKNAFFRIAAIISLLSYGLWIFTYITTPNESMGELALIAAYTVNIGFLGAFCILTWLGSIVMRLVRSRR